MSARFKHKRMYAVSLERVGIIAGTMAYSRRSAIELFTPFGQWEMYKRSGYRTVMAKVQVIDKRTARLPSDQRG
ncbi:hypothetical protein [Bradyrhizobium sp. 18]|uniref:hypothetical protein n=1 Tax=Bradyrhizobium sp. 18 TaxID=2782657 RepID=UPI001FFBCD5F|nr:hypothetical protein [Bradyrhizobium sp. 18]MCK1503907.1 hypothetical protein [Bradyrhizobium sp. 18]